MKVITLALIATAVGVSAAVAIVIAEKTRHYVPADDVNAAAPVQTHQKIRIYASPQRVWDLMANVNSWPAWQSDISAPSLAGAFVQGSTFDWKTGGLSIHSTLRVVEPTQRIVWSGPAFGSFAIHTWSFTPQNGYTEVEVRESMEGWLVSLASPLFQKGLDKSIARWLEALKKSAEEPTPKAA